jgi:hypothetical protein
MSLPEVPDWPIDIKLYNEKKNLIKYLENQLQTSERKLKSKNENDRRDVANKISGYRMKIFMNKKDLNEFNQKIERYYELI